MIISYFLFLALIPLFSSKIRGVNLGGWLVLEPWIRPSLFSQFLDKSPELTAIDEYTFNKRLGQNESRRQLEEHWSTWVTESDFQRISELGLTHIRIPFGWWIFGDSPDYIPAIHHLDRGIDLALKYDLKVLLDLHGVPGSQNGFDNSGIACSSIQYSKKCLTECPEFPLWAKNKTNIDMTEEILMKVLHRYKSHPAIWGIELVNEPFHTDLEVLKKFYRDMYGVIHEEAPLWKVVIHDSFRNNQWVNFLKRPEGLILDTHIYLAFNTEIYKKAEKEILNFTCSFGKTVDFMQEKELPTIVGEWSLAIDDCALHLNGFRQPIRKIDMGMTCNESHSDVFWRNLAKNQIWAFEKGEGWIMWNFKNELEDQWSWFKMAEKGWVPNAKHIEEFIKDSECNEN